MRIGEVAGQLGLNPKTIRYYEGRGLLPEPARTPSGYRSYDRDALERLGFIRTAQRLGFTLDEITEILALRDRGEPPCAYVRSVLRRQVTGIDQRIAELRHLRDQLVALDQAADGLPEAASGHCRIIDHGGRPGPPAPAGG